MADENEQERITVDVGNFVETMLARQTAFEAEVNARIARAEELEQLCARQGALLVESADALKAVIAGKTNWKRPEPGQAATN